MNRIMHAIVAIGSACLISTATAGPGLAIANERADWPPSPDDVVAIVGGEAVTWNDLQLAGVELRGPEGDGSDGAEPYLLDPADSLACNVLGVESHEVARIHDAAPYSGSVPFSGGRVSLQCGDSRFGYVHIRDRHESDWMNKILSVGVPPDQTGYWDDFMWFATINAVEAPELIRARTANQSLCYTTPIIIMLPGGMPSEPFYPTISVSPENRSVITAIPGGGCGVL